jgi:hypothetical protein
MLINSVFFSSSEKSGCSFQHFNPEMIAITRQNSRTMPDVPAYFRANFESDHPPGRNSGNQETSLTSS